MQPRVAGLNGCGSSVVVVVAVVLVVVVAAAWTTPASSTRPAATRFDIRIIAILRLRASVCPVGREFDVVGPPVDGSAVLKRRLEFHERVQLKPGLGRVRLTRRAV